MSPSALAFVLAFVVGCLMAFVRHPIYGLVTYIGVFYLHPPARWWGQGALFSVRWSFIAAGVTLLALAFHKPAAPTVKLKSSGAFIGFVIMVAWIALQSFWAIDPKAHSELVEFYVKFILVLFMICKCIQTEEHLRLFLWAHVLGCFYLGWIAYTSYDGGRFEDFGSPGITDANAAALQLVTGMVIAGSLFLASNLRAKGILLVATPFIVNALITTISRGGFLAAAVAGLVYNIFAPKKFHWRVRVMSVLAIGLFAMLTNDSYWDRMDTIKYKGADVEGVETGGGRLEIMAAQLKMARGRPFGCGHMCTTILSPEYIEARFLSAGARASHNTFMTMMVDHGIVGMVIYILMILWIYRTAKVALRSLKGEEGFLPTVVPAVAAALAAMCVADMFAQYTKLEVRIWFIGLFIVVAHMTAARSKEPAKDIVSEPTIVAARR